jgi:hypothetical protein
MKIGQPVIKLPRQKGVFKKRGLPLREQCFSEPERQARWWRPLENEKGPPAGWDRCHLSGFPGEAEQFSGATRKRIRQDPTLPRALTSSKLFSKERSPGMPALVRMTQSFVRSWRLRERPAILRVELFCPAAVMT